MNETDGNKGTNGRFSPNGLGGTGEERTHPMNRNAPAEDEIDLKELFSTLFRYKWTIVSIVAATTLLAVALAFYVTPIYQSEGSLMITDSRSGSSFGGEGGIASMMASSYGIGLGSSVSNELQILQSRKLSTRLAGKILSERRLPDGNLYPLLLGEDSVIVSQDTVAKRIRDKLQVAQVSRDADLVRIAFESPSPEEAARIVNYTMDTYQEISTGQQRMMAQSAIDFLREERMKVEERLTQNEEDLRQFMNEHQLVQVDAQTEELIRRISELETERQTIRVKLAAAGSAITRYEERLDNIKPGLADKYADAVAPTISRYQYQLAEMKTERMLLLSRNPELEQNPERAPELQRLNNEIASLQDEIRKLTNQLINQGDQFVGFIGDASGQIAEDISQLHEKLIELKVEQSSYQAQLEVLDERLAEQQAFFENLPDNMIQLARLKRDVKVNEELFLTIQQQYAEMALWEQTQFGKGRPVDTGYVPEEPVYPNKPLFVLVGMVLGGILAVGYVFVKEAMNTRIDGTEKLKKRGYPVLAVIPNLEKFAVNKEIRAGEEISVSGTRVSSNLVSLIDTVSPAAEAFRRLESNIIYSQPDKSYQTLLVTSSTKGEGKSTISANLAVALAEAGRNVLLLDLDLRRPALHKLFGMNLQPGLTDLLFNEAGTDEAIRPTVVDDVDLLASGKRPPNPANIMQSSGLTGLIDSLKERYDHIILDTPPFGIIMDSAPLMQRADGVILVARFNQTQEAQLDHAIENLEHVNAHILGTILTAFDYTQSSDTYSYDYFKQAYDDYREYVDESDQA